MKTYYDIVHHYDVDGCNGVKQKEEVIVSFEERADAETFVKEHNSPHKYGFSDRYDFFSGKLSIREKNVVSHLEMVPNLARILEKMENPTS